MPPPSIKNYSACSIATLPTLIFRWSTWPKMWAYFYRNPKPCP